MKTKTINELLNEIETIINEYQPNKQYQTRLSSLSKQLSDAYAEEMKKKGIDIKSINDNEKQGYQKAQKLGNYLYYGIHQTIQILTTKHESKVKDKNPLTLDEKEIVLKEINDLYDWLKANKDSISKEEYRLNYKVYLKLKSKLDETRIDLKSINIPVKKELDLDYTEQFVKGALKNLYKLQSYNVDSYNDLIQAVKVVKFSKNQLIAINQALNGDTIDVNLTKDYGLACKKIAKALNEQNVWKMEIINHIFLG